jgi:hypothetical protein
MAAARKASWANPHQNTQQQQQIWQGGPQEKVGRKGWGVEDESEWEE